MNTTIANRRIIRFLERLFLSPTRQQIVDYTTTISKLLFQRHGIFLSATVLAAVYVDATKAILCYSMVLLAEVLDLRLARKVSNWEGKDPKTARRIAWQILFNTLVSALAITAFVVQIALEQRVGGHFTPLFFLFAAALFCAMNNHQILGALILRLTIYAFAFGFIALIDIIRYAPPLSSYIWLQFFTVAFVMYFILDVSRLYLGMYKKNLAHLESLEEEHEKVKAAFRVKSNFVSTVSHELRTPLTSIKGSLDLMAAGSLGPVPDHLKSVLDLAGRNCERLSALINDILDVQSLEAGRFVSELKPLSVEDFVHEAVQVNYGFADKHGVYLDYQRPETDTMILGDRRRLIQVMTNLMSNAVKFSERGDAVTIRTEAHGDKAVIFVEDNGIGIPADAREKVFAQFEQVDNSDRRSHSGTGLGMNITRQIVDLHKGVIDFASEQGVGTTFMVAFSRWTPEHAGAEIKMHPHAEKLRALPAAE
ncbi:cell wall metabolism sensor histidine kinase WalK [Oceanicola sp. 22II-s10i]|uniref:sensor histidine kinase n=1 Tax=Oceanicola sp. 22II-s10i TaxID=1317116 RepID=UPI000B523BDD|nr:HAMP domain-containing sensor histidine kinase [Oceanicola sp. 22II-s10i]